MSIIKKHFARTTADSKQIHDLEIYSSKRIGKSVKIKYHLYINLRGLDKYVVNTRYNTINFYSPSNIKIHSNRYQLDANRRRSIHVHGEFSINVSNDVSSIDIWYENIGRLTRSSSQDLVDHTIIPKTKVGSVSVTKNIERTLTFKWVITDQEDTYNVYDLSSFTIPNIKPTSKYYTFLGWTTVKYNNTPDYDETITGNYLITEISHANLNSFLLSIPAISIRSIIRSLITTNLFIISANLI